MALPESYQLPLFPNYKTCAVCRRVLAPDAFYVRHKNHDGLENTCKDCFRARSSAYYQHHREACNAGARSRSSRKRVHGATAEDEQAPAPLPQHKVCSACRQLLPLDAFGPKQGTRDGLQSACVVCLRARSRAWYWRHHAACVTRARVHYAANYEHSKPARAAYAAAHKEQRRRYRAANVEHARAVARAWRAANPERMRRAARAAESKDRTAINERHQAWRRAHPEKGKEYYRRGYHTQKRKNARMVARTIRRAREYGAEGRFTMDDVRTLYADQDGLCAYCHRALSKAFHIDHVVPLSRGGSNWPNNLALACGPCNRSKWKRTGEEFRTILKARCRS